MKITLSYAFISDIEGDTPGVCAVSKELAQSNPPTRTKRTLMTIRTNS